jgi:hypothetical protein
MKYAVGRYGLILFFLTLVYLPAEVGAITAREVFDEAIKRNLGDTFRVVLTISTFKGKKAVSKHVLWLMGKTGPERSSFFLDFDEPEESKGLRFLIILSKGKRPEAFMYLPATKRTIPLAADDPSVDLGGTGLTMEDIDVFHLKGQEKSEIVGEEKKRGRECYKIEVDGSQPGGKRFMWISKKGFHVIRSENIDAKGKVERILDVLEFFKTAKGREFPRVEEITVPGRNTRIRVRQEHGVFGIVIPEEITDPKSFGTFKWRQ